MALIVTATMPVQHAKEQVMNPDPIVMEIYRDIRQRNERIESARKAGLHRAAMVRRNKRKRGGKK